MSDTTMLNGLDIRADMEIPGSFFEQMSGPEFIDTSGETVPEPSWELSYHMANAQEARRQERRNRAERRPANRTERRNRAEEQSDVPARAARPRARQEPADMIQQTNETPVQNAAAERPIPAGARRRGRETRRARDTGVFGRLTPARSTNGPAIRNRPVRERAEMNRPIRRPAPVIPRGLGQTILRTTLAVAAAAISLYGVITNWNTVKSVAMQFAVSWIILFIVLTYFARRYLQVNQIAGAATILSIIAVVLLNNVFGLGSAVSCTVAGIFSCVFHALLPLAILTFVLFLLLRSLFR